MLLVSHANVPFNHFRRAAGCWEAAAHPTTSPAGRKLRRGESQGLRAPRHGSARCDRVSRARHCDAARLRVSGRRRHSRRSKHRQRGSTRSSSRFDASRALAEVLRPPATGWPSGSPVRDTGGDYAGSGRPAARRSRCLPGVDRRAACTPSNSRRRLVARLRDPGVAEGARGRFRRRHSNVTSEPARRRAGRTRHERRHTSRRRRCPSEFRELPIATTVIGCGSSCLPAAPRGGRPC